MVATTAIREIASRASQIDKALRSGRLTAQQSCHLSQSYAYVYKDDGSTLGMGRSGAAESDTADDDTGIIWFTTTVLDEDRDGDVVAPEGRQGKNYERNPVFFFGHQEWAIPVGSGWENGPGSRVMVEVSKDRVRQGCRFDREDPDADFLYGKVKRGMLNSTSIAFVPLVAHRRDEVEKARTHSKPGQPPGWYFEQWDHTETSIVGVPSNPGALRDDLDREKGFITPRLYKCLGGYAAKARGRCFGGWCPRPAAKKKSCGCKDCRAGHDCPCEKSGDPWMDEVDEILRHTKGKDHSGFPKADVEAIRASGASPKQAAVAIVAADKKGGSFAKGSQADMESSTQAGEIDRTKTRVVTKPFAGYSDFDDCTSRNRDKRDPDAYCGSIQNNVEGKASAPGRAGGGTYTSTDDATQQARPGDTVIARKMIFTQERLGTTSQLVPGRVVANAGDRLTVSDNDGNGWLVVRNKAGVQAKVRWSDVRAAKLPAGTLPGGRKLSLQIGTEKGFKPDIRDLKVSMRGQDWVLVDSVSEEEFGPYKTHPEAVAAGRQYAATGQKPKLYRMQKQLSEASGSAGGYTVASPEPVPRQQRNGGKGAPETDTDTHGFVICADCDGTGNCPICGGDGLKPDESNQPCSTCGGSGECPECAGAGSVTKSTTSSKGKKMATKQKNTRRKVAKAADEDVDDEEKGSDFEEDATHGGSDDDDAGEVVTAEEEDDVEKDSMDEPFNPKPSAMVLAKLYKHLQEIPGYLENELGTMDNADVAKGLEGFVDKFVAKASEYISGLLDKTHGNGDAEYMDKCMKAMEADTGGAGSVETGEENKVDVGEIPPDDEVEMAAPGTDEWAEEEMNEPEHKGLSQSDLKIVQDRNSGDYYVVGQDKNGNGIRRGPYDSIDEAGRARKEIAVTKDDGRTDNSREEILERYQDAKGWHERKHAVRVTKDGRRYLVRAKDGGDSAYVIGSGGIDDDADSGDANQPTKEYSEYATYAKDASDFLTEVASDQEAMPSKQLRTVAKSHGRLLGQVHKALTQAGKVQRDGGPGSALTDDGKVQRDGGGGSALSDTGELQTSHGTPGREVITGGGAKSPEDGPDGTGKKPGILKGQLGKGTTLNPAVLERMERLFGTAKQLGVVKDN